MEKLACLLADAARRRGMIFHPGRDRIYKWEDRRATPSDVYQMLLADVLGVDQADVQELGWPWWLPAFDAPHSFSARGNRAALTEVLVTQPHRDRRTFLALTTGALVSVASDWVAIEPERLAGALHGRRVDPHLLAWLETRTGELRALTNTAAPECTELVQVLLKTTIKIIDGAVFDEPTGRRLHQVAAAAAQCAGWLHFDQHEYAAAQRHWLAALHAAHGAADRDLGAGILSDLAYSTTWLDHPDTAVSILEHARTRTHSPAARSLLDLRRARALAALGDRHGASCALLSAERELDRAQPGAAPAWVAWMCPADLQVDAGRCWLDLNEPARADRSLSEGLGLLDPARARTRSLALVYRAESALARRDAPAAAADTQAALDTALTTTAARCIDQARTAMGKLAQHRGHPAVAELFAYADSCASRR
ncbi:XRE family transcriptional regulator [Streptomyces sp. NPDC021354]|uniref:XRE family transcriptional regulator n=1 Tax=Streptomyces sp. NPDC021354 TaxID=3154793 RepID=UPI0033F1C89C